jgi:hypothetical protein
VDDLVFCESDSALANSAKRRAEPMTDKTTLHLRKS